MIPPGMTSNQLVKSWGQTLQAARVDRSFTLRELAGLAKTSHQTVAAFEAGTGAHLPTLLRIAGRLGLQLELRENETSAG